MTDPSPIIRQPFSHGPGFWICKMCAAGVTEGVMEHAPGCGWIAVLRARAAAAERDRIIGIASQLRASIPADHPPGAQVSFADYLRLTAGGAT